MMSALFRHLHRILVLACCILYGASFAYPAVIPRHAPQPLFGDFPQPVATHFETRTKAVIASGDPNDLTGQEAFDLAWALHMKSWWGNPALWLGVILLALRLWSCVPFVAFAGSVFAAEPAWGQFNADYSDHDIGVGYWLWFGSIALLFVGSLAGWCWFVTREERRAPDEVFRGWRGVAIGSWLTAGSVALLVWWSASYFHPPAAWRNALIGIWLALGLVNFAAKQVENDFTLGRLWRAVTVGIWLVFGLTAFTMWCFWADICPPPPPR